MDEEASAAEPVAGERRDERGTRRAREPGAHDEAHLRGSDPQSAEVDPQQDAHHPGREGAQERGGVEDAAIAETAQPGTPSLAFSDA